MTLKLKIASVLALVALCLSMTFAYAENNGAGKKVPGSDWGWETGGR